MSKVTPKEEEKHTDVASVVHEDLNVEGTPFFKKPCCCNDFCFLFIFIAFLVGLFVIWGIAGQRGDARRLVYPMDRFGNLCGIDNGSPSTDFREKKYLAWYDSANWESQICVAACRSNAAKLHANISMDYFSKSEIYDTHANLDKKYPRYDDIEILRRCQPKNMTNLPNSMKDVMEDESYQAFYSDLQKSLWLISVMAVVAAVLCMLYVWFLRYFACEMMWLTVAIALGLLTAASLFLIAKGSGKLPDDFKGSSNTMIASSFGEEEEQASLGVGIGLLLIDLVLLLAVIWFNKRISLVGNMIEEAGLVLMDVKSLFLFPILPLLFSIGFFFLWMYNTLMIASAGTMDVSKSVQFSMGLKCDCDCDKPDNHHRIGEFDSTTKFCLFYNFVGLIWIETFIFAITRTTIAGTASAWYFTRDHDEIAGKSDQLSFLIVGRSLFRTLRYNLGSLAFGSFVLTLTSLVKWFIDGCLAIAKKTEKSPSMQWFIAFVNCCVKVIAKLIEYITKYSYIQISMYGISFCDAAHRSANLMEKNAAKIGVVDTVGDLMLFFCQLAVSVTIGFMFYAIVLSSSFISHNGALTHPKAVSLVASLVAYVVSISFFGVMEAVIDTILICFCEDLESNGPEKGRPYYMRDTLKQFIESHENLMNPVASDKS
eukprot:c5536_g1_i1.p1 GENE.c5536_g1_i1~~c5536_g1_i1.p1  ORF type:complete len:654 (-),score=162.71 c5536_g1_i1:78-2039(-)